MPEQELSFIETNRVDAAPLTEETDASFHESNLPYSLEEVQHARRVAAGLFEATIKAPEVLTVPMEILSYGARASAMRQDAANGIPAPEKALESWERFGLAA